MLSLNEIIEKIIKGSSLDEKEVNAQIDKKVEELGGVVSKTGAALVVAREHNVDMEMKAAARELKINELEPQMSNVSFFGKVLSVYPVNEFKTEKGEGKVQNILLGDESSRIRMSFWNEEISKAADIKEGDVILVENPWIVSDNQGRPEARLGRGGSLKKAEKDITVDALSRKDGLEDIKDGDAISFTGTVVEVHDRALIYDFCPECRARLSSGECERHGKVAPDRMLIISCLVDDGKRSISTVFFREVAERLLGKNVKKIAEELTEKDPSDVTSGIVSKRFKIDGRVKLSKFTGDLEIVANDVDEV